MIGRANIVHARVIAKLWHHSNIIVGGELIFLSFSIGIYKSYAKSVTSLCNFRSEIMFAEM